MLRLSQDKQWGFFWLLAGRARLWRLKWRNDLIEQSAT